MILRIREADFHWRKAVELFLAQLVHHDVVYVGIETVHHVAHEFVRPELKYLICDVRHHHGVYSVEPSSYVVGRWVFYHHGRRTGIHERSLRILVPCIAAENCDAEQKPVPL